MLSEPQKSVSEGMGGERMDRAAAQVDHIVSRKNGGTNSYGNARVVSLEWNNGVKRAR